MKKYEKTKTQETVLLKDLQLNGRVTLKEAMEKMCLSESTVRRLFARMEQKGLAIRTYGDISLPSSTYNFYHYETSKGLHVEEKRLIAQEAVKMIHDGDTIFLDSGTTVFLFSLALSKAIEEKKLKNVRIFTNSFMILDNLNQSVPVNLVGGEYRPNRKDFCGYMTEKVIKEFHYNKCILGTDGFDVRNGFSTTDFNTARICETAIAQSDTSIILMDSHKFNNPATISYSKGDNISAVVVDEGITLEQKKMLMEAGVSVVVAKKMTETVKNFTENA